MNRIFFCALLLSAITSCKHDPVVPNTAEGGTSTELIIDSVCDVNTVYFVNDIQPILNNSCAYSGCHSANSAADGVILSDYQSVIATADVRAGNAGNSELYEVIEKGEMPPGNPLPADQQALIMQWINQGAKHNECVEQQAPACDTVAVSFASVIEPIIAVKCRSCHQGSSASKGVRLENYTQIKAAADNGSLRGILRGTNGYKIMPPGNGLPECDINQIQAWINQGAQNN